MIWVGIGMWWVRMSMRPWIDEGPWLDEYGWILAVCYHVTFTIMFTRLMFSDKRK